MADDKKLDIAPGVRTAVRQEVLTAVREALEGINLVDLKSCQEELQATRHALLDMQQNFEVWRSLAQMRGDQSEQRGAQIDELQQRITEMSTEIALLRSALENRTAL